MRVEGEKGEGEGLTSDKVRGEELPFFTPMNYIGDKMCRRSTIRPLEMIACHKHRFQAGVFHRLSGLIMMMTDGEDGK